MSRVAWCGSCPVITYSRITIGSATGIECVFDLSPAPMPCEVHYRQHGQVFFRMPCVPGSAAIVSRNATVTSNHTYVSKLHAGEVVRWIGLFA